MKTNLIYLFLILVTLLSCGEESISVDVPNVSDSDKTVSITLTNIPTGFVGSPVYIFTLNNKGQAYAVQQGVALENAVIKVVPVKGFASFDVAAFIPANAEWTMKDKFAAGNYSRITDITNPKGAFVTSNWNNVGDLLAAATTGITATLEAVLTVNGSATPADVDFGKSEIVTLDAVVTDHIKSKITSVAFLLDKSELKSNSVKPYRFQFNTVSVATGSHMLYVKATNEAGHTALDSVRIYISEAGSEGPSISFTSLVNGSKFTRQQVLTIAATASDPDDGLDKVELKINNVLVGTDRTAPYSFTWDTFRNAVGTVTLELIAYDKSGQFRSDIVNVTLQAPTNYFPRATFTNPLNGASINAGQTISLTATATDTEGDPINRVEFSYRKSTAVSDILIGQDTTSPYSFDFNTTGLTTGDYFIFVTAFDNSGNFSYEGITITIK